MKTLKEKNGKMMELLCGTSMDWNPEWLIEGFELGGFEKISLKSLESLMPKKEDFKSLTEWKLARMNPRRFENLSSDLRLLLQNYEEHNISLLLKDKVRVMPSVAIIAEYVDGFIVFDNIKVGCTTFPIGRLEQDETNQPSFEKLLFDKVSTDVEDYKLLFRKDYSLDDMLIKQTFYHVRNINSMPKNMVKDKYRNMRFVNFERLMCLSNPSIELKMVQDRYKRKNGFD